MFSISDILSSAICLIGLCFLLPSVIRTAFQHNYDNRHEDLQNELQMERIKHEELTRELESINKSIQALKHEIIEENERFRTIKNEMILQHKSNEEWKKHKLEKEFMMNIINDTLIHLQPTLINHFIKISKNI